MFNDKVEKKQSTLESIAKIQEFHKQGFEDMVIKKVSDKEMHQNINCNPEVHGIITKAMKEL